MDLKALTGQRILVTSLNWGMGHLARSIGLIHRLTEQKNELYFAGNEEQLSIIIQYFPSIRTHFLSDYPFRFAVNRSIKTSLFRSSFSLIGHIKKEQYEIEKIVSTCSIDVLISDHRYGCYSSNATSIFLTHQLQLPLNGIWRLGNVIHRFLMKPFDVFWIPDYPNSRLSGKLSSVGKLNNVHFIGPLSRFEKYIEQVKTIDLVVVSSGPDSFALQFAKQFLRDKHDSDSVVLIAKRQVLDQLQFPETIKTVESTDWRRCDHYISSAKQLVSACGYSTLMDIEYLKCRAFLIPTAGQLEQEYLWQLHQERIGMNQQLRTELING